MPPNGIKPPCSAMPFMIAPCRTRARRSGGSCRPRPPRPGAAPFQCVRFEPVRSAEPPISSGRTGASASMAFCEALRVATVLPSRCLLREIARSRAPKLARQLAGHAARTPRERWVRPRVGLERSPHGARARAPRPRVEGADGCRRDLERRVRPAEPSPGAWRARPRRAARRAPRGRRPCRASPCR